MSIQIEKVIQTYDYCLIYLEAKKNLFIQSQQLNTVFQRFNLVRNQQKNLCLQYVQDGLLKILKTWLKKFKTYEQFADYHKHSYTQLQFKVQNLKNNGQILSREDQLLAQIQTNIRMWRQNMNPVEYYNNKYRKMLKSQTLQKLEMLKNAQQKNYHSISPLYTKKIQNQFKENLSTTYYDQYKIDTKLVEETIIVQNQMAQLLGRLDQNLQQIIVPSELSPQKSRLLREIAYIMSKNIKPTENRLNSYHQALYQNLSKIQRYWRTYRNNVQFLTTMMDQLEKSLMKIKQDFESKQQAIHKLLTEIPKSFSVIFRTDIIYNLIKSFNSSYFILSTLRKFKQKLSSRKEILVRMQKQCFQYNNKMRLINAQRYENFYHHLMVDKRFLQQQFKSKQLLIEDQKSITRSIINSFKQFLQQCYNLTKQTRRYFTKQCKTQAIEPNELSYQLEKLIINFYDNLSSKSVMSNRVNSQFDAKNQQAYRQNLKQKINKISQFIDSIKTFSSANISESQNHYSCALGPKLLLHGKLYVLSQGLFFQSHFNKKNLLFGKTKLFIPKQQIVQIDRKNTLKIFPDAVLIKTQRGLVSFHALGQRKIISAAIKQAYLGINKQQDLLEVQDTAGDQFKQFDQQKKVPENICEKLSKPLQVVITEINLKGSKLPKVFRKYFSDDPFELNGQKYPTFKTYAMSLIQAKNPQSSSISPGPPSYFQYKSQEGNQNHYPQSSVRIHKYGKSLPKIPFLSKGGDGKCEQKETFNWLGPDLFTIDILSTVKGFSLTQSMQIWIKYVVKQVSDGVQIKVSCQIKFLKQSSSNGLVKNPTIANMKQSITKIMATIQKCERTRKVGNKQEQSSGVQTDGGASSQTNQESIQNSTQIQLSKKKIQYIAIGFFIFYLFSLFIVKLF